MHRDIEARVGTVRSLEATLALAQEHGAPFEEATHLQHAYDQARAGFGFFRECI